MGGDEGDGLSYPSPVAAQEGKPTSAGLPLETTSQGGKNDLYNELWHACAGPLVYVPQTGERVFYFPQGHLEQVKAYTDGDCRTEMPVYKLPSKILCKVMCVQLKAEANTDEVFAQILLFPEAKQDESNLGRNSKLSPQKASSRFFSKKLTPSDTSTHGGFSVPKRHAEECLPPLDMSQQPPTQELVAKDLHGNEWHFRHIYRGHPKRHLLTSGWSTFLSSKKLVTGDVFIFLRGENEELCVGVRRTIKSQNYALASVISCHSMQHGILASASHAISTGTMFTIYYRPWTSPEFIVPFDHYMKSAEADYSVGTRFRMPFEGEESMEQRVIGTIVGIEDVDSIRWPNSEWRCLKVKWDAASDASLHPERVCPWSIEPAESTKKQEPSVLRCQKRPRPDRDGLLQGSDDHATYPGVFQGQEISDRSVNQSGAQKQQLLPHLTLPLNHGCYPTQLQMENPLEIAISDLFYQRPSSTELLSGRNMASFGLPNHCPPTFLSYGVYEKAVASRRFPLPNVNSHVNMLQEGRAFKLRDENEAIFAEPNGGSRIMLFGVNLFDTPQELPSPQVLTPSEQESLCSIPPPSQSSASETNQVSEPSKGTTSVNLSENQWKNCCSVTNRSCTKVLKHGTALGRSVDLMRFDGYQELISELDQMFDFQGSLINGSSGWFLTYTDNEGDLMLIGDSSWQEFQHIVRKMLICPKEEINRLNSSSQDSTPP
ncbi:hypothetical protein SLE2022_244150 [Rubroshorea leprosula]